MARKSGNAVAKPMAIVRFLRGRQNLTEPQEFQGNVHCKRNISLRMYQLLRDVDGRISANESIPSLQSVIRGHGPEEHRTYMEFPRPIIQAGPGSHPVRPYSGLLMIS